MTKRIKKRVLSELHKKRIGAANRGKKRTKKMRQEMSRRMVGRVSWSRGKKRPNLTGNKNGFWGKHHSEETKKKISISNTGRFLGNKSSLYGRSPSEETRKKISLANSGTNSAWWGRKHSDKTKEKMRQKALGRKLSEETKKKISLSKIGKPFDEQTRKKISEARKRNPPFKGKHHSPEARLKLSLLAKKRWRDPEYIRMWLRKKDVSPNKVESILIRFLNEFFPSEYKFVGNGEFILAGKCPDFLNINGQKKIIELYGNYWHRNDDPQKRINLFKEYGYNTLIIWESELKDLNLLKNKISSFNFAKKK